jgi:hypothetical protein
VLLYITIAFGQAVDIQIMVHDAAGLSYPLWFGLDLTATDDIDPALGESDLPPPPPGNGFDARWWLPPFDGALSSWRDYRAPGNPPEFPFTGVIQHSIKFQSTDFPITISWDLPPEISTNSVIQDVFGGVLVSATFAGNDSLVVTNPGIVQLNVTVDYSGIIPVELTSFTAKVSGQNVLLNWSTATETNNKGFEVERSQKSEAGNQNWDKVGFINGNGTTSEPKSYSFTDNNVDEGTYFYRLKQIDYDGSINYSNEITLAVGNSPTNYSLSQNYPNPFNPSTVIQYQVPKTTDISIKIFDLTGQEVKALFSGKVKEGKHTVEWNGLNKNGILMSSGIYLYQIESKEFVQSKKMILMK